MTHVVKKMTTYRSDICLKCPASLICASGAADKNKFTIRAGYPYLLQHGDTAFHLSEKCPEIIAQKSLAQGLELTPDQLRRIGHYQSKALGKKGGGS